MTITYLVITVQIDNSMLTCAVTSDIQRSTPIYQRILCLRETRVAPSSRFGPQYAKCNNPSTINTSTKSTRNTSRINTYKIAELKVPQNEHLQKNRGQGTPAPARNPRPSPDWKGVYQTEPRNPTSPAAKTNSVRMAP